MVVKHVCQGGTGGREIKRERGRMGGLVESTGVTITEVNRCVITVPQGLFVTYLKAPQKNDYFILTLDKAVSVKTIRVYSGQTNENLYALNNAIIEISEDGKTFKDIATCNNQRKIKVTFQDKQTVKVLRIRFTKDSLGENNKRKGSVIIRGINFDQ